MVKENQLVVVLSRNYTTGVAVIRSLGIAGYTVDLVACAGKEGASRLARASKYLRKSVEVVSRKLKEETDTELMRALFSYRDQTGHKPVLFPTDDYTAAMIDLNYDALSEIFLLPGIVGGREGDIVHYMNKDVQAELARSFGLLTPKEWTFNLEEEIVIPEDMVYPCFCKPIESARGLKRDLRKCEDREELWKHLNKLRRAYYHRSVLVQEYLEIDREIDLSGISLDQEIIIPGIIQKTQVASYYKGVTVAGVLLPTEELGASLQEKTVQMLRSLHFQGMFDLEFNVVGDQVYFNEINLRSGGPNFAYFKSGVNLPDILVRGMTGIPREADSEVIRTFGKSFVYEKMAWDDYIHGFLTKQELNELLHTSDIKLLELEEDPEPGKVLMEEVRQQHKEQRKKDRKKARTRFFNRHIAPILRPIKHMLFHYPQMKRGNERNPDSDQVRVMVAGRNYCSNLSMARSLGEAGYEVEVLRIFLRKQNLTAFMKKLKPEAYSRYVKAFYTCIAKRRDRNKIIAKRLIHLADPDRRMLLIPTDDLIANVADEYYDQLSEYYILPNVDHRQGQITHLMEKGVQKELARKAGLPVVSSCVIRSYNGKFEIPDSVSYPCFIKPNISKNSSKSYMRICSDRSELLETMTTYAQELDVEFLCEDYVDIRHEYSLLGLSTSEGAIAPGFFIDEVGGTKEHLGVAMQGRITEPGSLQPLVDRIVAFVGSLGYNGLFDVDLMEASDGTVYFVELNLRYGASGYAVTQCGVNLPAMYADYMLFHKPIDSDCRLLQSNRVFVSERVIIEELAAGRIPLKDARSLMRSADIHFIKSDSDPKAYRYFRKYFLYAAWLGRKES